MAQLGIDYGTTNTVVVGCDRGHYPVLPHVCDTAIGPVIRDVFPSLVAYDREANGFLFGSDAERALLHPEADTRIAVIRSLKRLIRDYAEGHRMLDDVVPGGCDPAVLLTGFLKAVKASIRRSGVVTDDTLETVITWPANANGAQRHVTRQAFRDAGFRVTAALSEPVASAIEYADRVAHGNRTQARALVSTVVVFDLGGGTLDISLVRIDGQTYTVLAATGIEHLGGDDMDEALARRFARGLGLDYEGLPPFRRALLLMHACRQKESLGAGARTLTASADDLGLEGGICTVKAAQALEDARELYRPAVERLRDLLYGETARAAGIRRGAIDAIYLVGGASKLPAISALLARHFPRTPRVITDKPFTSVAMGAAIHCAEHLRLHDVLARTFGVVRLAGDGTREVFDPIFPAGTRLPEAGARPLTRTASYPPRHNIGRLRYLECVATDVDGQPTEGVRLWSDVLFPYDPRTPVGTALTPDQIQCRGDLGGTFVHETYTCDADGVISVRIQRDCDGRARTYEIFKT